MPGSGSRAATVRLVGGRPCLDLVNTVSWRGDPDRREEHLRTGADALVWLRRAGVLTAAEADELAPVADAVLAGLLPAREAVAPLADGAGAGAALQAGIRDAIAHSELGPAGWTVVAALDTKLATVLDRANKDSMNLYAESLCKRLGHEASGQPGSWENGPAAVGAHNF